MSERSKTRRRKLSFFIVFFAPSSIFTLGRMPESRGNPFITRVRFRTCLPRCCLPSRSSGDRFGVAECADKRHDDRFGDAANATLIPSSAVRLSSIVVCLLCPTDQTKLLASDIVLFRASFVHSFRGRRPRLAESRSMRRRLATRFRRVRAWLVTFDLPPVIRPVRRWTERTHARARVKRRRARSFRV